MQIYLLFILMFHLLTVSLSDVTSEENDNNPAPVELKAENVEHRRKLPIFPRNRLKFVVNLKPYVEKLKTYPKDKSMTRMPLMPHVTPRTTAVIFATTKLISRKPVMKLRTFTIKSRGNGNYNKAEKKTRGPTHVPIKTETQKEIEDKMIDTTVSKNVTVADLIENPVTDAYLPEESHINIEIQLLNQSDRKTSKQKQDTVVQPDLDNFSSEEEADRAEFIFLENKNEKQNTNYNLGIDQDIETLEPTTRHYVVEKGLRVKRSKNIIEEENLASTTSGFKYTGRDTRMNNDGYFKNINV